MHLMTDLSLAAQALMDAYCTEADRRNRAVTEAEMVAAALRAMANKVLPHSAWGSDRDSPAFYRWQQKMKTRSWILSIARELEEKA